MKSTTFVKKIKLSHLVAIILGSTLLISCRHDEPTVTPASEVEQQMKEMTLREKVGQLFCIRPEALDTTIHWTSPAADLMPLETQEVNSMMYAVNKRYPVGGVILYAWNIKDEAQLGRFVSQLKSLNGSPLLCIDEEGGRVARIANNDNFDVKKYESMAAIGATGDPANAFECGSTIGSYLHKYGFDIDFAPVADVNTNPENIIIGARAFSDDPHVAAPMVTSYLAGLKQAGVTGCIKHFPGHGDTQADTHYGYAQSMKTWAQMDTCEMITFRAGIRWGCQLIMTAHISAPNVTGTDIPATMSSIFLQDKLRRELGYQQIIITDAMEMGAITMQYSNVEATIGCIQAGVDIILCPHNFIEAFDAVVAAVENGTISQVRLDESVRRILLLKKQIRNESYN